jgi:DNA replication and repair protein RecF
MYVTALRLADFRSYAEAALDLGPGATVFLGANGQGKTNLVEAVGYVATLGSHRVASDAPLIRSGANQAVVQARIRAGANDDRVLTVDLEIHRAGANRARLNKAPVRPREVLGALRTVLFAPEDLSIPKGDPADRRGFLDTLVTARWPRLAGVRADYDRALRQRTALLKALSGKTYRPAAPGSEETLDVWTDRLSDLGAELTAARVATVADLAPLFAARYAAIAPVTSGAAAAYLHHAPPAPEAAADLADLSDLSDQAGLAAHYRAEFARRRPDEIARGQTLVGPHRDDLALTLDGLPVKGYASHGEAWSTALGLRLASLDLLRADGIEPVLILDDVFAELDETRRSRLAEVVATTEQVLVTAAVPADVPAGLAAASFRVEAGTVRPA